MADKATLSVRLTPKQKRFVEQYLVDLNATQAAIRAGYSARTANQQGPRLLVNAGIQQAISVGLAKASEKAELSVDWVLGRLRTVAERCMQAEPVLDRRGEPVYVETPTGDVAPAYTFQAAPANRSLELLGKHLGLFPDKVEHTGKDGAPIEVADVTEVELARRIAFALQSGAQQQGPTEH